MIANADASSANDKPAEVRASDIPAATSIHRWANLVIVFIIFSLYDSQITVIEQFQHSISMLKEKATMLFQVCIAHIYLQNTRPPQYFCIFVN